MPKANIYGFPPSDTVDTKIVIFDEVSFGTPDAVTLFEGEPDAQGIVRCDLPKEYIGREIRLVAMPDMYNYIGEPLEVSRLGVFHTVRLSRDMGLPSATEKLPVEPNEWSRQAQEHMRKEYRAARYKNYISKIVFWILTIGSPIAGLLLAGLAGVIVGFMISVITMALSRFASGHARGI